MRQTHARTASGNSAWYLNCDHIINRRIYHSFDGNIKRSFATVVVEGFPEDEDSLFAGGLDRELSVLVAADEAVDDLRVGRVRLVAVEGLDPSKDRQTCKRKL